MPTNNKPIISFRNVTFSYDKATIIKHASFEIFPGEFIGMIGPNGGGKTTAIKLMLNFLKPQDGNVELANASIGYVPQTNTYDKQFPISVLEVVLSGALKELTPFGKYTHNTRRKALELLEQFNLQDLKSHPFGGLSGGQAQKTLIARALISDPSILLLDEPTANIDTQTEEQIFSFLHQLKGKKTICIVTHNFDAIVKNVERVLCFQHEVSSLKPEEVCEHFALGMYHSTKGKPHG